jgi:hypothetical protein
VSFQLIIRKTKIEDAPLRSNPRDVPMEKDEFPIDN